MEKVIGRKLNKNEVVHHIDGNRDNNNPDNLSVLTNDEHIKLHHRITDPHIDERLCTKCGSKTEWKKSDHCFNWKRSRIYKKWLCNKCYQVELRMVKKVRNKLISLL